MKIHLNGYFMPLIVYYCTLGFPNPLLFYFYAFEGGGGGIGDFDADVVSGVMRATIEDYHFVLLGASEELVMRALAYALYEDFVFLADAALVALGAEFVLQGDEFFETMDLCFFRHVVGKVARGVSAGTFAVFKHE